MQIATEQSSLLGLEQGRVWDTQSAYEHLHELGSADTKRTAERRLQALNFLPQELDAPRLLDELGRPPNRLVLAWALEQARRKRARILFAQLTPLPSGKPCLHLNDARGARFWLPLPSEEPHVVLDAIGRLQQHLKKAIALFPHGLLIGKLRDQAFPAETYWIEQAYQPLPCPRAPSHPLHRWASPHLKHLEAESIHIIREAIAEAQNPAMLYSIGKDSSVMLHLARKAFFPGPPPFPLLHVDTQWKFQEMYMFRERMANESGMQLLVHTNPDAIQKGINPFDHGSALHTDITKTAGLKQAIDQYKFDVLFGGARRDEEKSRAKERIFSFRSQSHSWDPKNQRPELWNLYSTRKKQGESIRVFPLSNWTEIDIWQYIYQENIPIVPLYFAKPRAVIIRPEMIMMVDDDRCRINESESIEIRKVRFRTLGCYPLTGAMESNAESIEDILLELIQSRQSERQGRKIDSDSASSMEKKKQEGYF